MTTSAITICMARCYHVPLIQPEKSMTREPFCGRRGRRSKRLIIVSRSVGGESSRQLGSLWACCCPGLAAEEGCQRALVGEARLLRDDCQRLMGSTHQHLCPFDPPLHDIVLWHHPDRLLKGATEMIGAETCDTG